MSDYLGSVTACPSLPNRRRFASVWSKAKARPLRQRLFDNRSMRSTTSWIGSVAPMRSFRQESPAEMIQDEIEQLRAMLDERQQLQMSG